MEDCALSQGPFRPSPPAVAAEDALHVSESDSTSGKVLGTMESLEHLEKLVDVLHVEADAVVAHVEGGLRGVPLPLDIDDRFGSRGGVLQRVGEKVPDDYGHHG